MKIKGWTILPSFLIEDDFLDRNEPGKWSIRPLFCYHVFFLWSTMSSLCGHVYTDRIKMDLLTCTQMLQNTWTENVVCPYLKKKKKPIWHRVTPKKEFLKESISRTLEGRIGSRNLFINRSLLVPLENTYLFEGIFMYLCIRVLCLNAIEKRESYLLTDGCDPSCACWELNPGLL